MGPSLTSEDRWKVGDKGKGESEMGSCLASASSFLRAVFSSLSSCTGWTRR